MSKRKERDRAARGRVWAVSSFIFSVLGDAVLILVAFALAYWIRFHSALIPPSRGVPSFSYYLSGSLFIMIVWLFVFYFLGLHDEKRKLSYLDEAWEVFKGAVIGTLIALFPTFFFRAFTYSRLVVVIASILAVVLVLSGRAGFRLLKALAHKRGFGLKRVAIVGGGEMGEAILERIEKRPELGYLVVGQILENSKGRIRKIPTLGRLGGIREIVEANRVESLIITFPLRSHHKVTKILSECEDLGVDFQFIPDVYEMMTSKMSLYEIDGIPLIGLKEFPLAGWGRLAKRAIDIALSFLFLAVVSPFMVMISILIKLTSKGPVLFRQERVGEDGRTFQIFKFRSMKVEAEQKTGPVFATANDTRRTKLGAALRKASLDEIPQLINVLRGEMSLVGPRPERPHFVEQFQEEVPRYLERHRVKSRITGWAQVNGLRGNTSIEERVKHDLYYIENWSLGFDLKILMRTVANMFHKHAY